MQIELIEKLSAPTDEELQILGGERLDKNIYTSGADFTIGAEKMIERGKDITLRTHTRYIDFPEHKHNYLEVMAVLRGSITHRLHDTELTLTEGDVLVLNKHASHAIKRAETNDIGVNVIISDSFISSLSGELSSTLFADIVAENAKTDGAGMYIAFSTAGDRRIENVIENLLYELTEGGADMPILKKTVSLLFDLLSRGGDGMLKIANRLPDEQSRRKKEIESYIKHSYRSASLRELSSRLYLSEPYLSSLIKLYFGRSFKDMLLEQRLKRACLLLRETDIPISDIIRTVGYENESYFHRAFKEHIKLSPLGYRKRYYKGKVN